MIEEKISAYKYCVERYSLLSSEAKEGYSIIAKLETQRKDLLTKLNLEG